MRIYPRLKVNVDAFRNNFRIIDGICRDAGIENVFVCKGADGMKELVEAAVLEGAGVVGSSRIEHFADLGMDWKKAEKLLIRIPSEAEAEDAVKWTDISLNSDLKVLRALDREAERQGKIHGVILMVDLGDLREGFWDEEEYLEAVRTVENELGSLRLDGIGTNLGCYGSVLATEDKMERLAVIAEKGEKEAGHRFRYVSGGGTTSLPLVIKGKMHEKINMLRIGEAVLSAKDLSEKPYCCNPEGMRKDVFILETQLAEVKTKPSVPVGEIAVDGFGFTREYEDRGIIRHGIVCAGKLDYIYPEMLIPLQKGVEVLGASSDHTILDLTGADREYETGDVLGFALPYANMAALAGRKDVPKVLCGDIG